MLLMMLSVKEWSNLPEGKNIYFKVVIIQLPEFKLILTTQPRLVPGFY